jgi:hypothetical protein
MVNDLFDVLSNSVCHSIFEDFCIDVHEGDWPVVLFLEVSLPGFGISVILASENDLVSVPSLSISWYTLRRVGISPF